ncbi:hypothetical protein [Gemmata sp.]|uniref:hypothetical protein n=1 Tax=Gemmata sp. TaxID=1914242 RepID=UPI003F71A093
MPETHPTRYEVLEASQMNADLWAIAHAVEDLADRIDAFRREYHKETPLELWADAGIPASAPGEYIAEEMVRHLSELAGFRWALNAAAGCIQPFGEDPRDAADMDEADTPAVAAAG